MPEPIQQPNPQQQVNVYTMSDYQTKNTWLGGAYDAQSGIAIACALYVAAQQYNATTQRLIGIFDSSDLLIGFIGHIE